MTTKIEIVNIEHGDKFTAYTEDGQRFVFISDLKKDGGIDKRAKTKNYHPKWVGEYKGARYAVVRPGIEPTADALREKIAALQAQIRDLDKSLYDLYVNAEN